MKNNNRKHQAHMICVSVNMEETGANIKRLIKASGYSMEDIMTFTGVSTPQAIYKWFSGKSLPSIESLIVLSEVLGMSIRNIIVIDGEFDPLVEDDSTEG